MKKIIVCGLLFNIFIGSVYAAALNCSSPPVGAAPTISGATNTRSPITLTFLPSTSDKHFELYTNGTYTELYTNTYSDPVGSAAASYTYKVRRIIEDNGAGVYICSPWSSLFTANVIPAPNAPTGLTVSYTGDYESIDLSWSAPVSGAPVGDYQVEYQRNGGAWQDADPRPTTPSKSIPDLMEGNYRFRVSACNTYSNVRMCSTPIVSQPLNIVRILDNISHVEVYDEEDNPGQLVLIPYDDLIIPINTPAKDTNGQFYIYWDPLSGTVDLYKYRQSVDGVWGVSWTQTDSNKNWQYFQVTDSGEYQFEVQACNTRGCTQPTQTKTFLVEYENSGGGEPPSDSPKSKISGSHQSRNNIKLTFSPSMEYFDIIRDGVDITCNHASTTYTETAQPGETHTYKVKAYVGNGQADPNECWHRTLEAAWSDEFTVEVIGAPGIPSSIQNASTTSETLAGNFTISWGSASGHVHRYHVQQWSRRLGRDGQYITPGSWTDFDMGTSQSLIRNNMPDGDYRYQVKACNTINSEELCSDYRELIGDIRVWSYEASIRDNLSAPAKARAGHTLEWINAGDPGDRVKLREDGSWDGTYHHENVSGPNTIDIEGASAGLHTYSASVCILIDANGGNVYDCTPYGREISVEVIPAPDQPGNLQVAGYSDNDSITVSWNAPGGGAKVGDYKLEYRYEGGAWQEYNPPTSFEDTPDSATPATTETIQGLQEGNYHFRVSACNTYDGQRECSAGIESGHNSYVANIVFEAGLPEALPWEDNTVGVLQAEAGVSGGSASYSVPIKVVPGRSGMQPEVSLNYSNRNGNSVVGMGWSLSVVSKIHRCAATQAQDSYSAGVQYDANRDRLCLDGQRLVNITGAYGASGTVYRTELDNFVRVTQTGALNTSTTYFTAEYKNNRIRYFGREDNAKHHAQGRSEILNWAVSSEQDRSGNTMHYTYKDWSNGEYTLESITYTGHSSDATVGDRSVEFEYQKRVDANGKTDFSSMYMAGGLTRQTQRLKTIRIKYQGTDVREYGFYYGGMSLSSGRSLLRKVQECAFKNNERYCLPETQFDWQEASPNYVLEPVEFKQGAATIAATNSAYVSQIAPRGDVNGDGVRDWPGEGVRHDNLPTTDGYYVNAEGEVVGTHRESLGGCFKAFGALSPTCLDADFNQDGRSDAFLYNIIDRNFQIRYAGDSTWTNTGINLQYLFDKPLGFADFNGDGWPDIAVRESDEAPYAPNVYIYLNTKNPQAPFNATNRIFIYELSTHPVEGNMVFKQDVQVQGDMDGNGTPDFIVYLTPVPQDDTPGMPEPDKIIFTHSQANGQMTLSNYTFTGHLEMDDLNLGESHFFYDINGDGLPDWLSMNTQHYLEAKLNKGGFFADQWQNIGVKVPTRLHWRELEPGEPEPYILPNTAKLMEMDYNGDGKTELMIASNIVAEGCGQVRHYVNGQEIQEEMCGDELWGSVRLNNSSNQYSPIDGERKDISARTYQAIYFKEDINGKIFATTGSTDIIAATTERMAIDATGNGLTDVVTTFTCKITGCRLQGTAYQEGVTYINRNLGASSDPEQYESIDVIKTVTNGFDKQHHWVYRPLGSDKYDTSAGDFYTPDHDYLEGEVENNDQEYFHFSASMNVVAEYKTSNGIGGENTMRYRYSGATFNNRGRGFMGFRSITVDDLAQGIKTKTVFHQKWPKVSLIEQSCTWLTGENEFISDCGNAITEINADYKAPIATTPKTVWVGMESETEITRDLTTRAHISTETKNGFVYDGYGNPLNISTTHHDDYGTVTHHVANIYEINESAWWLDKLTQSSKTFDSVLRGSNALNPETGTDDQKTTATYYTWNSQHRRPSSVRVEGGQTVDTQYTSYGLPESITVSATDVSARQTQTSYTTDGYFANTITNALGHISSIETDKAHGLPTSVSDANGLITTTQYDAFGRPTTVTAPGQTAINTDIALCDVDCENHIISESLHHVAYQVNVTQLGRPDQTQYFDQLGRAVLSKRKAFDGGYIYNKVSYDALGRKTFESVPYHAGEANNIGTHYDHYDALGRLTEKTVDQAMDNTQFTTSYTHSKYTTTITADTLTLSRSYNGLGQLMQTIDAMDGRTRYAYDSAGNPIAVEDADGHIIISRFDDLSRKQWVDDPNMGLKSFSYNGLGEVIDTTDANGDKLSNIYDELGRVTTVKLNDVTDSIWVYDTRLKGRLTSHTRDGGLKNFYYDIDGRLSRTQHTIDATTAYDIGHHYDSLGRPSAMAYPNGPTVNYDYNTSGYIYQHSNASSGYVYTQITAQNAWQHTTGLSLAGGNITETSNYYTNTGQMKDIITTRQNDSSTVHHITYDDYDVFGNLKEKTTRYNNASTTETFSYDGLHRLTQSTRNGAANETVNYDYNATGNLILKSDYASSYTYTGSGHCGNKPNAVCQISKTGGGITSFDYDANGNLLNGDGKTLTYDAYNKPKTIEQNNIKSIFHYGADLARYKQIKQDLNTSAETTIYYLDKHVEIIQNGHLTKTRYYLNGSVILEKTNDNGNESERLSYLHKDRLGSIATITDENGTILERRGFDPFGKPRDGNWGDKAPPILNSDNTDRGFTGHEHLDDQQLIHMNGRIYDYNLGRFYSVDPYIQSPSNSQSINPYSYIMNNPLAGVDPTGYRSTIGLGCETKISCRSYNFSNKADESTTSETYSGASDSFSLDTESLEDMSKEAKKIIEEMVGEDPLKKSTQALEENIPDSIRDTVEKLSLTNKNMRLPVNNGNGRDDSGNGNGGSTNPDKWYWASMVSNLLGLVLGVGENSLLTFAMDANGGWRSFINGRWYPSTWDGSSLHGYKSTITGGIKLLDFSGATLFAIGAINSGFQAGDDLLQGNWAGVGKNTGEVAIGYLGAFAGWPGLIAAGSYYTIEYTIGIEALSTPTADLMCSISGNC